MVFLITPVMLPYILSYITPFKEFRVRLMCTILAQCVPPGRSSKDRSSKAYIGRNFALFWDLAWLLFSVLGCFPWKPSFCGMSLSGDLVKVWFRDAWLVLASTQRKPKHTKYKEWAGTGSIWGSPQVSSKDLTVSACKWNILVRKKTSWHVHKRRRAVAGDYQVDQ